MAEGDAVSRRILIVCLLACIAVLAGEPTWQPVRHEADRLFKLGRYAEARDLIRQTLRAGSSWSDVDAGMLSWTLACAHHALGETDQAGSQYRLALRALERAGGEAEVYLGRALADWALLLELEQRFEEAERTRSRAHEILSRRLGPSHRETLVVQGELALGLSARGDSVQAERMFRELIRAWASTDVPPDTRLGMIWIGLGRLFLNTRRLPEAADAFSKSAAIIEAQLGPRHPKLADALLGQASAYAEMRRFDAAEEVLIRANGFVETSLPPEHPVRSSIVSLHYKVLRAAGRGKEAKELEKTYRANIKAAGNSRHTVSWSELLRDRK